MLGVYGHGREVLVAEKSGKGLYLREYRTLLFFTLLFFSLLFYISLIYLWYLLIRQHVSGVRVKGLVVVFIEVG